MSFKMVTRQALKDWNHERPPVNSIYLNSFTVSRSSNRQHHGQRNTSYRKFYFNEFVQNSFHCDMGMIILGPIILDLQGYGDC